jgi:hypothetical protein
MTMLHGLPSLAARRIADSTCDVIYNTLTPEDDGSSIVTETVLTLKASIKPLQPKDIERLQTGGIEIQEGVSIIISEALDERPERIEADGKKWRVRSWSFIPAYENESGNPIGTVAAMCDEMRVAAAVIE